MLDRARTDEAIVVRETSIGVEDGVEGDLHPEKYLSTLGVFECDLIFSQSLKYGEG